MKKTLLFTFGLLLLASCNTTEKMLARQWRVTDAVIVDSLEHLTITQQEVLSKALKANVTIAINKDSTLNLVSGGNTLNSKWWLTADKKGFYATGPENKLVNNRIILLSKEELQYEMDMENQVVVRFACEPIAGKK